MNVLIVAGSRVGGTKIGEWLSYELGIEYIHEPFAHWRSELGIDYNRRKLIKELNNVIVKVFPGKEFETLTEEIGIKWDKIIGIVRENEEECVQSILMAEDTNVWHSEYSITNEWLESNKERIEENKERVREWNKRIRENPIIGHQITYEGIYNTKTDMESLKEYLGVREWRFDSMLNPKWRYRRDSSQPPQPKTLI